MALQLEDVKGIGKKVVTLKDAGIDTVEKLAEVKLEDLIELKGIGKTTAQKMIDNAKELMIKEKGVPVTEIETEEASSKELEEEKRIKEEIKKLEEKKARLQNKKVEEGDFVLVKITARTQKGKIFRVSSDEDAKKKRGFLMKKKLNKDTIHLSL